MNYLKWLEELDQKSQGKYVEVACPFFKDGACEIYEKRFACCRNFPQSVGYCSQDMDCKIIQSKIEKNSSASSLACHTCQKSCCEKILVPVGIEITKEFIEKWMNIPCEDCRKFF